MQVGFGNPLVFSTAAGSPSGSLHLELVPERGRALKAVEDVARLIEGEAVAPAADGNQFFGRSFFHSSSLFAIQKP
jgi:hypothetical protein